MMPLQQQELFDQRERDRFIGELDTNFSVIAPAGVGKTMAIVDRVVALALRDVSIGTDQLSRLVVVTYTRKAADEMQTRAREALLRKGVGPEILVRFNRSFFGTIHGFCSDLIRQYGPTAGFRIEEVIESDEAVWNDYLRQTDRLLENGEPLPAVRLLRNLSLEKLAALARRLPPSLAGRSQLAGEEPVEALAQVSTFVPDSRNAEAVAVAKGLVANWLDAAEKGEPFSPIPAFRKGGRAFQEVWKSSWSEWKDWYSAHLVEAAAGLSHSYQAYRLSKGLLTYDDLVDVSRSLLRDPETGSQIRRKQLRVLLDEAQDTDGSQFEVLSEVARSASAKEVWGDGSESGPEPGRFCMVGDPQQAIYGSRADLATYRQFHRRMVAGCGQELVFNVTMRCQRAVVNFVNRAFPSVLRRQQAASRQVDFVPLHPRPKAGTGQVLRVELRPSDSFGLDRQTSRNAREAAKAVARWLRRRSPWELHASDWSRVALLCPRNDWLDVVYSALREAGIPVQSHSRAKTGRERPARAWLAALAWIVAHPTDEFEIYGVLREVLAVSDRDIADFRRSAREGKSGTKYRPLQILLPDNWGGTVGGALRELYELRRDALGRPLRDAANFLVEAMSLEQRLAQLPGINRDREADVLEQLLVSAGASENQEVSFDAWASRLVESLVRPEPEAVSEMGAIQLLTCHRAKGLGWDAVLVPFFFRPVARPRVAYPHVFVDSVEARTALILDAGHGRIAERQRMQLNFEEELDRLVYVAATRARHTLVLFDDASFYGSWAKSLADRLGFAEGGAERSTWMELANRPVALDRTMDSAPAANPPRGDGERIIDPDCLRTARRRAGEFPLRRIPSRLVHEVPAGLSEEKNREGLLDAVDLGEDTVREGVDYGNWWHAAMQRVPWSEDPENWIGSLHASVERCPEPDRGNDEIERLLASPLYDLISRPGNVIRTEVPLLWNEDPRQTWEGFVDMVIFAGDRERCRIVDWKTDRWRKGMTAEYLRNRYSPQIRVYLRALGGITRLPVEAGIYLTVTGEFLEIDDVS